MKTEQGDKNIEDIQVGDRVLSQNDVTGEEGYKTVTATFDHLAEEIYTIHVGGQEIQSTYNHPFWVEGKGWTYVKDLKVGDELTQADGTKLAIEQIELESLSARVYNMTVDEFHTYFVSDLGIWVHNTNNRDCDLSGLVKGIGKANLQVESLWRPTEKMSDLWSKGKLKTHYDKHRDEFGVQSSTEYSDMAYKFGTSKSDSIIQVKNGAFIYRYEPATKSIFVGTEKGGKIKSFYKWDDRADDEVILTMRQKGLIE